MDDWKSKSVKTYVAVHLWLHRKYGKASRCEHCKQDKHLYHWANISGEYRRDISDWKQLCVSCHRKMDWTETQTHRMSLSHKKYDADIVQKNSRGRILRKYQTLREAHIETGISRTAINNCLMGRSKMSGGFKWTYDL